MRSRWASVPVPQTFLRPGVLEKPSTATHYSICGRCERDEWILLEADRSVGAKLQVSPAGFISSPGHDGAHAGVRVGRTAGLCPHIRRCRRAHASVATPDRVIQRVPRLPGLTTHHI